MQLGRWSLQHRTAMLTGIALFMGQFLLTGCGLGQLIGGTPPPPDPQTLYNALLNRPFPQNQLPAGFSAPQIQELNPGPSLMKYRALGGVEIDLRGPDTVDSILYWVFPTAAEAKGYFEEPFTGIDGAFAPTSFLYPGLCLTFIHSSDSKHYGVTACHVLVGNVEVVGISQQRDELQGNDASALALAQGGIVHLKAVQGQPG